MYLLINLFIHLFIYFFLEVGLNWTMGNDTEKLHSNLGHCPAVDGPRPPVFSDLSQYDGDCGPSQVFPKQHSSVKVVWQLRYL